MLKIPKLSNYGFKTCLYRFHEELLDGTTKFTSYMCPWQGFVKTRTVDL